MYECISSKSFPWRLDIPPSKCAYLPLNECLLYIRVLVAVAVALVVVVVALLLQHSPGNTIITFSTSYIPSTGKHNIFTYAFAPLFFPTLRLSDSVQSGYFVMFLEVTTWFIDLIFFIHVRLVSTQKQIEFLASLLN